MRAYVRQCSVIVHNHCKRGSLLFLLKVTVCTELYCLEGVIQATVACTESDQYSLLNATLCITGTERKR